MENKEISFKIGAIYNDVTYYINYGNFIVTEAPENDETNGNIKVIALDYMQKFNQPFKDEYEYGSSTVEITYPCTLMAYLQHVCNQAGVILGTQSITNGNFVVTTNQFQNKTLREVLQHICKSSFGWARIGQDNKLYLDFTATGTAVETLTTNDYYADSFKKANEYYGAINKVTYADRDIEGQEESIEDSASILLNGIKELVIYDNYFAYTQTKKQDLIQNGGVLFGLYYMPISQLDMKGLVYLESSDFINVTAPDGTVYFTKVFNHTIYYEGYVKNSIENGTETDTQKEYKNTSSESYQNSKTEIMVDRANQKIDLVASRTIIVSDEIEKEGIIATEEAKNIPPWEIKITGKKEYDSGGSVITRDYTIVVMPERYPYISAEDGEILLTENNEEIIYSTHKYTIESDELLFKDGISDTIDIDIDRNVILTKRIGIEDGHTYILDEEIITTLGTLTVDLYKGKNYIYIEDDEESILYIKYILDNEFTKTYVSNVEVISAINMSPEEISIQSHRIALEGYTTINEGFSIDEEGNMTCNDAIVNGTIKDNDGNILVWNEGVYSNLQFVSTCSNGDGVLMGNLFSNIGYYYSVGAFWMSYLLIEANIPPNFAVTEAYITVTHQPIAYSGEDPDEGVDMTGVIGRGTNIQIFADDSSFSSNRYELQFGSEFIDETEMSGTDTRSLGRNGSGDGVTFSQDETEVIVSKDLSQYFNADGATIFKIGSKDSTSIITGTSSEKIKKMYSRVGKATARLNVYGYLRKE